MSETSLASRPALVGKAIILLYATLGIGLVRGAFEFPALAQQSSSTYILATWAIVLAVNIFLIFMISRRHNWARIAFLVLFVIGAGLSVDPMLKSLSSAPLSGLLGVAQLACQLIATLMLFQAAANAWFRRSTA